MGTPAPDFTLRDQQGRSHTLSEYQGRPVVLFFYPKDMTSGCTTEACDFQSRLEEFDKLGVVVLGISILDEKSKSKFAAREGLTFPLLADSQTGPDGKPAPEVAQAFGVWAEKSMYGRTYFGIVRTTVLIGRDGTVAQRWDKVKVAGHVAEVLEAAREAL